MERFYLNLEVELVLFRRSDLWFCPEWSAEPLRSAKAREFGKLRREKCTRAPWTFPFKVARNSFLACAADARTRLAHVQIAILYPQNFWEIYISIKNISER